MKTLTVNHKNLDTSPIRTLVRNGEKNADYVNILLDRYYDGTDLSEFSFTMEAVNSENTLSVQSLSCTASSETLSLLWKITPDFTAVSGKLSLTLKAANEALDACIVFLGEDIEILGSSNEDLLPSEIPEQILTQLENKLFSAISQISDKSAEEAQKLSERISEEISSSLPRNAVTSDSVFKIEALTQEQYDAIEAPDSKTLYIIE